MKLEKGRIYIAEMSLGSKVFSACPGFKYTGQGNDQPGFSGEEKGKTVRLIFKAGYSGEYEAMAGTFDDLSKAACPYKLSVYQAAKK